MGPTEVVKQRRPTVHPIVHTIFKPEAGEKHVLLSSNQQKTETETKTHQTATSPIEDEKISTLIHMTSNHDAEYANEPTDGAAKAAAEEHEYSELDFKVHYNRERQTSSDSYDSEENERDTASVSSGDMYSSQAASIFLSVGDKNNRPSNESQASQTSA